MRIIQIGVGGYGTFLLRGLLQAPSDLTYEVVAAIDPAPESAPAAAELLREHQIPSYANLDALPNPSDVDLAIVASPIHLHAEQCIACMRLGMQVLCEKPLAGDVASARLMQEVEQETGKSCGIGFQWSFTDPIQELKQDVLRGRFGPPRRAKALALWPRPEHYYQRNRWAGRRTLDDGTVVNDSPISNATAHFLHNLLFLLGDQQDRASPATDVAAELYRINPIQTFDAAALRATVNNNCELLYYAAHSCHALINPVFEITCDQARISYAWNNGNGIIAECASGERITYGDPQPHSYDKLYKTIAACRDQQKFLCTATTALPHLALSESLLDLPVLEPDQEHQAEKESGPSRLKYIRGLDSLWVQAYSANQLPHETGLAAWTQSASCC